MKKFLKFTGLSFLLGFANVIYGQDAVVVSPDEKLKVELANNAGVPLYSVVYDGKTMLEKSPLGFKSNIEDFTKGMKFINSKKIKSVKNIPTKK